MNLLGVTCTVASLEKSKQFYEDLLGFEPSAYYAPTAWQSYKVQEGVFFAIGEAPGSTNEVTITVADVEGLWARVKDREEVVRPLEWTPWGSYRFVIKDPDGHLLAFRSNQS